MAREATAADRPQLEKLFKACFTCYPSTFVRWMFEERIQREYISVVERDGCIVAAAHAMPQRIRIRGGVLPGGIIGFVGVMPEFRGCGLAGEAVQSCLESLRRRGAAVAVINSGEAVAYCRQGFKPIAQTQITELAAPVPRVEAGEAIEIDVAADAGAVIKCYERFSAQYTLLTVRNQHDFMFKCSEYLSRAAKCLAIVGRSGLDAYCIFREGRRGVHSLELVATSPESFGKMSREMAWYSRGKVMQLRLPADVYAPLPGASIRVPLTTAICAADVTKLLPAAGFKGFIVGVDDKAIPANTGVYTIDGERTEGEPQIKFDSGSLALWVAGGMSLDELERSGGVRIIDPSVRERLRRLEKRPCYIVEEF